MAHHISLLRFHSNPHMWKSASRVVVKCSVPRASPWWYSLQLHSHTIFFFSSASGLCQGISLVLHFAHWAWVPSLIYCTHWNYPLRSDWWMPLEASLWHSCLLCSVQKHWWNYLQSAMCQEIQTELPKSISLRYYSKRSEFSEGTRTAQCRFGAWISSLSQL